MADEFQLWRQLGNRILESPGDDDLRHAFATALENGDGADRNDFVRAYFIRLQLRLASMGPDHPEWMRLAVAAHSLLLHHEHEWTPEVYRSPGMRRPEFHRGFLEGIAVRAEDLIERADEIFTEAPIRHLDIVDLQNGMPLNEFFHELFLRSTFFPKLISLRLDDQKVTNEDVVHLAFRPWESLRWLSLAHNEIGAEGVQTLIDQHVLNNGTLKNLEFVDLHNNPVDPVEEITFDQDVVVGRRLTEWGRRYPEIRWLHREVVAGQLVYPNRFAPGLNRAEAPPPALVEA